MKKTVCKMKPNLKFNKNYIYFLFLLFAVFFIIPVEKVSAATTRCKYVWNYTMGENNADYTFILETEKNAKRLTKITGQISTVSFANKENLGIALNSDGTCPNVSFYYGSVKGALIYKGNASCVKNNSRNKNNCSADVKGELITSDQSSGYLGESVQYKLKGSSDSTCSYSWTSLVNDSKFTYNIEMKKQNNNKVTGDCDEPYADRSCRVSISDDFQKKFYTSDNFVCPPYVYVKRSYTEKSATYHIEDVGVTTDGDRSLEWMSQKGDQLDDPLETGKAKGDCEIISKSSEFFQILKQIIGYIQIGTIFLVLILGVIDLTGAVGSEKDDALKKAVSRFGKRMIAAVLVFLVPAIINIALNIVNISSCGVGNDQDIISELFK